MWEAKVADDTNLVLLSVSYSYHKSVLENAPTKGVEVLWAPVEFYTKYSCSSGDERFEVDLLTYLPYCDE